VSVSLLLSHRLSVTRSNLAVLESMFGAPAPGPGPSSFKRVTKVQAAGASPSLVEVLEQLDIAAGRVSGAVCDACSAPRPADTKLKMCSRCHLAACVVAPLYSAAIAHVRQPQVLQRRVSADALASTLRRVLRSGHLLAG